MGLMTSARRRVAFFATGFFFADDFFFATGFFFAAGFFGTAFFTVFFLAEAVFLAADFFRVGFFLLTVFFLRAGFFLAMKKVYQNERLAIFVSSLVLAFLRVPSCPLWLTSLNLSTRESPQSQPAASAHGPPAPGSFRCRRCDWSR